MVDVPVEHQGAECLSVHVLGHNDQRFAVLVGDLQGRHDALYAGDLLLTQQHVGVLELDLLTWKQTIDFLALCIIFFTGSVRQYEHGYLWRC